MTARTRVKICGITTRDAALAACDAGADAIGFVFVKASPRYIEPERAFEIQAALPPLVATVGVFQDHTVDEFCDAEERCPTTHAQLHGAESEQLVAQCGPVIRAFRFDAGTIAADLARWEAHEDVDALMVDGSAGGTGESFDWAALAAVRGVVTKPLFLSGGLNATNVGEAIRVVGPYAVDVSSGVESSRGVKRVELIRAFCAAVRAADRG